MKAIIVTQELKDLNAYYFKNDVVGNIKSVGNVPKNFNSITYNIGKRTDGYQTLAPSTHRADGFFSVVQPTFDTTIEKLGAMIFDEPNQAFTYTVVALTQVELDANTERDLLNDQASLFFNKRKFDGEAYIERFNAFVFRKVVTNEITKPQAVTTLGFFYEALHPLMFGYFEEAKSRVNALTTANAGLNTIKNKISTEIQTYLNNE